MSFAVCAGLIGNSSFAAPPEPLDVDFLDYLANCERKDDNWTVVASDKERKKVAAPSPAKPPASVAEDAKPEVPKEAKP